MEERKVFGASGSKTLKELLAEAEAPAKKLSARSGAAPPSNGAHHVGQTPLLPRATEASISVPVKNFEHRVSIVA